MKGQYDDQLKWPLQGRCDVKLLNQISNCKHISNEGYYRHGSHFRVNSGVRSNYFMWYSPQFVSNQRLCMTTTTCQYLRDDTIFLQVDYKLD